MGCTAKYMDWLILKDPESIEILEDAKRKLMDECVDLDTLKKMTVHDAEYWKIKWGFGRRLMRGIKEYVRDVVTEES
jgi:hypothetical protein